MTGVCDSGNELPGSLKLGVFYRLDYSQFLKEAPALRTEVILRNYIVQKAGPSGRAVWDEDLGRLDAETVVRIDFKGDKIHSTPSFGGGVKQSAPYCMIFGMSKILRSINKDTY
jgi:hypothetical protein